MTLGKSTIAKYVAIGVLAIVCAWATVLTFKYFTAEVRGKVAANETIQSGGSRIANYNHFFNLCASIQGNEAQINSLLDEQKTATGKNLERINASITGVKSARLGAIYQYNADAAKSYTQGQFRSSNLPYQIPANNYPDGGGTKCVGY